MPTAALTSPVEHLLLGLDDAQTAAVTSESKVLAIVAGAGSGKTRVLTRRIARRVVDGSADPKKVLAITFTNKAVGEMGFRLSGLLGEDLVGRRHRYLARRTPGPTVVTFHRLGYLLLQQGWQKNDERQQRATPRRRGLMQEALGGIGEASLTADLLRWEVEWAKARMISPQDYAAAAAVGRRVVATGRREVALEAVAAAYAAYEQLKRRKGVLDVDDFVIEAIRLLERDPSFRQGRQFWYRHIFVDEFQDLSAREFHLLRLLVGDNPDLCVVGDPNQAIYGWNGADPSLLSNISSHFPGAEVVRLDANYRCRRPIVAAAGAVLAVPVPPVCQGAEDGPTPVLWSFSDESAENMGVSRWVSQKVREYGPSGVAVLAPIRVRLLPVAELLRRDGIACEVVGASLLHEPEVKGVVAYLRRFDPLRHGRPVRDLADDLRDLCERSARCIALDDSSGDQDYYPIKGLADDAPDFLARQANLDAFMDLVDEYVSAQPRGDFESFEEWADTVLARRDIGLRSKGVKLSTIHRGKGLEWSAVAIMGLVEGALPSRHVHSAADLEESARVAYVAMTRASRELVCTWSQTTTMGTPQVQATRPSRFFHHLPKIDGTTGITQVADSEERVDRETAIRLVRELRQTLRRGAVDSGTG